MAIRGIKQCKTCLGVLLPSPPLSASPLYIHPTACLVSRILHELYGNVEAVRMDDLLGPRPHPEVQGARVSCWSNSSSFCSAKHPLSCSLL